MADDGVHYAEERLEAAPTTWIWCFHCERCYQRKDARQVRDRQVGLLELCAYPDCDGDALFDARLYDGVREHLQLNWPIIPERDHKYGLYD